MGSARAGTFAREDRDPFAIAFAFALIQAPFRGHGHFVDGLRVSLLVTGTLLLLMAAVGGNTALERRMDYGITESAWGRVPGVSTLRRHPEDPTLSPGVVFVGSGLALLLAAFVI